MRRCSFSYDTVRHSATAYDANGNTLSDPSGKQYTWDFENRLIQAVVPGTSGGTTTFRYDPFGRRIQKSGPLGTTNYVYDGASLIEEVGSSGYVAARYTQGKRIDEPLAQLSAGDTSYYENEGLGSITSLTSTSGAPTNTYSYNSFGNLTSSSGAITSPFQYTGREYDAETGLLYYRNRYFDTNAGRFISEDPIGFVGGLNYYVYTFNNATSLIDPYGLTPGPGGCNGSCPNGLSSCMQDCSQAYFSCQLRQGWPGLECWLFGPSPLRHGGTSCGATSFGPDVCLHNLGWCQLGCQSKCVGPYPPTIMPPGVPPPHRQSTWF